jgi:teichoic acid transport system permease protein
MKYPKRLFAMFAAFLVMLGSFYLLSSYFKVNQPIKLQFEVLLDHPAELQLFVADSAEGWDEKNSITTPYVNSGNWEHIIMKVPQEGTFLRLDTGNAQGNISLRNPILEVNKSVALPLNQLEGQYHDFAPVEISTYELHGTSMGADPYLYFDAAALLAEAGKGYNPLDLAIDTAASTAAGLLFYFLLRYSKDTYSYARELISSRRLVLSLAKNDFKTKYASSYLGVLWGFIHPLLTIATYWFVFQVGLRSGNIGDVPFILWFIAGIIPWFFFSDAISSATNAFYEYSYLVKKVVFKIQLLPAVKIFSAFFVQIFFTVFIFVVYGAYGYPPTLISLQLIYYLFAMLVLVVALSLITSSIVLFFKDLNQIITVILQIGFWFTPIGWPVTMLSGGWAMLFKLNPMFYIVQGYRDTLVDHILFYERPYQMLYFWIFCLVALALGTKIFKRLKPHFADVL